MASAKKKFASKMKNDVDVMIKVKDEEGKIVEFETEDLPAPVKKVKKKATAKTVRAGPEMAAAMVAGASIDAEDTLAMIKNALKSGTGIMAEEFGAIDGDAAPAKKKKTVAKKKKKVDPDMPKLELNTDEEVKDSTRESLVGGASEQDF